MQPFCIFFLVLKLQSEEVAPQVYHVIYNMVVLVHTPSDLYPVFSLVVLSHTPTAAKPKWASRRSGNAETCMVQKVKKISTQTGLWAAQYFILSMLAREKIEENSSNFLQRAEMQLLSICAQHDKLSNFVRSLNPKSNLMWDQIGIYSNLGEKVEKEEETWRISLFVCLLSPPLWRQQQQQDTLWTSLLSTSTVTE